MAIAYIKSADGTYWIARCYCNLDVDFKDVSFWLIPGTFNDECESTLPLEY